MRPLQEHGCVACPPSLLAGLSDSSLEGLTDGIGDWSLSWISSRRCFLALVEGTAGGFWILAFLDGSKASVAGLGMGA